VDQFHRALQGGPGYGHAEIGHAEIAGARHQGAPLLAAHCQAESKEDFWDLWSKENEETVANFFIVRVLLIGFTSEEQMEYDERVLMDIMTPWRDRPRTKPSDESWIKNADSAGMWLMCGGYVSVDYVIETLTQSPAHGPSYAELKKQYTPPLMPTTAIPAGSRASNWGTRAIRNSWSTGIRTTTPTRWISSTWTPPR